MGSTIPKSDDATGSTSLKIHSFAQVQATAKAAGPAGVAGLDVSGYQTGINWSTVAKNGAKFVYVKASEGTTYHSSQFASQYNGSYSAGLTRGAYHFATPNTSSGATQATYFVKNGGSWTADGRTLPPLLDIEYGYNGQTCWGLSQAAMVSWISSFTSTVKQLTGIRPAIYTTTDWWSRCTGNNGGFSANPLFLAHYTTASTPGTLPNGWKSWSIWQWADAGVFPGDQDVFNGTAAGLKVLATGTSSATVAVTAPSSSSTLSAGATLASGRSIKSSNGQFTLNMQTDGNLVLSGNGHLLWFSKTGGNAGARLTMQADGNLVIYTKANKAIWYTSTTGAGSKLVVQSNGDLQLVSTYGVVFSTGGLVGTSYLNQGVTLRGGGNLHDSTGSIQAIMQTDGNFVVYIGGKAKFSTRTYGNPGAYLTFQGDGNLIVYSKAGKALWVAAGTYHTGSTGVLGMQADGNLVLTNGGRVRWFSHTSI
jgi:GH25 family lysozyme M1 (1,4-beta-N-acetylmuramidase)